MNEKPGQLVGAWTLQHPLGSDGATWTARDQSGRPGALKLGYSLDSEEAALRRLDHPGIPSVLDRVQEPPALVTTLVLGARLDSLGRTLADDLMLPLARDICGLVAHSHDRGVAHGDLRPERMLVDPTGRVYVLGFGARRPLDLDEVGAMTPAFAPPEWHAAQPVDPLKADAFSLGVSLHELCTGVHHRRSQQITDLPLVPEGRVTEIAEVVRRLTDPDPATRWTASQALILLARRPTRASLALSLGSTGEIEPLDDPPTDHPLERVGRYRIVRELGRGGMGMVYEAIDEELERRVALKLLPQGTLSGSRVEKRFLREARAVAKLEHPAIVRVLDIGRSDRGLFFAMEYIEGGTLSERLHRQGRVSWQTALRWIAEAADAVQHAHQRGIVHRDLKPGNLMLDSADHIHIVDFGLAFPLDEDITAMTRTGSVLGTPMYMAPEQAMGRREMIGPRADVYALGVVLFELLSGRTPFDGETSMEILQAVAAGRGLDLDDVTNDIPRSAVLICRKAMSVDPDDRYQTASAFAEDLLRASRGERVRPSGPSLRRVAVRLLESRRHVMASVGGLLAVTLLTIAIFGGWRRWQAEAAMQAREADAADRLSTLMATVEERRKTGERQQANDLLRTFASDPQHHGTAAAWRAWTELAQALARDRDEDAGKAWVQAWSEAPDSALQADALLGLASYYRARDDYRSLAAVLRVLKETSPERMVAPEVERLSLVLRVATGTTTGADRADRLLAALGSAHPTGVRGTQAFVLQEDATSQRRHMWAVGAAPDSAFRLDLGRPTRVPLPVSQAERFLPLPGSLLLVRDGESSRWSFDGNGWHQLGMWTDTPLLSAASADLDQDGEAELYATDITRLLRLNGERWEPVEPDTSGAGSVLGPLQATDLDSDGHAELVLAAREWGAYDVRLIEGPIPHLSSRQKLGVVDELVAWRSSHGPSIAALKVDRWPSRDVFQASWASGAQAGIWLLRRGEDGALVRDGSVHPTIGQTQSGLYAADLDGDGDDELVTNTPAGLQVVVEGAPSHLLPGLLALGALDVDEDGDAELLVGPNTALNVPVDLWWLGTGDSRPPLPEVDDRPVRTLERPSDLGIAQHWADVELLANMGLPAAAAELAHTAAVFTPVAADRVITLRTAGQLYEAAGAALSAANSWSEAARLSGSDLDRRAASTQWRSLHRPEEELRHLKAIHMPDTGDLHRMAQLAWLDRPNPDVVLSFEGGSAWRALSPMGAYYDANENTLDVAALPGPLLALPVRYDGGGLQIQVELEHETIEWGGRLRVGIGPEVAGGSSLWGVELAGTGGGGFIHQRAAVDLGLNLGPTAGAEDVPTGVVTRHIFTWLPSDDVVAYGLFQGDTELARISNPILLPEARIPPLPGGWLRVEVAGGVPAAVRTHIRSIAAWGLTQRDGIVDPHPGWLQLLLGRADLQTSLDPMDRAAALLALGDLAGAVKLVLDHPEHPLQPRLLDHLLHIEADRALPLVAADLGPSLPLRFAEAWRDVMLSERYNPAVRALALHPLLDASRSPLPTSPAGLEQLASLLRVRTGSAIERGQLATAASTLAVWSRIDLTPPELAPARRHHLTARLALAQGDVARAMAEVHAALTYDGGRSVVADRMLVDPALRALMTEPGWELVTEAAAGRRVAP